MINHHFLLISLPAQSHINPTLQLAKKLTRAGARVTFATTTRGLRRMTTLPTVHGLSYTSFSDGHDDDEGQISDNYMADLKRFGSQSLTNLLRTLSNDANPVTFLVYTVLLPWAAAVARDMHVPSAFLAIQNATTFAIYHRFFNSRDGIHDGVNKIDPSISINLPGLPSLTSNDLPSFLLPTSPYYSSMIPIFQEHIETLEQDPNPCVLANTFDALEEDSIKAISDTTISVIAIGPLIPSAFSDGFDVSDKSFGCDLFKNSSVDYRQWLDTKPEGSVVYVSFGSLAVLQERQKEEILQGLVESGVQFLWVIRDKEEDVVIENGLMVRWCSQVEVLFHRSVGCFVTHCGWNSTVESLVAGVPVVGCPQFSDQMTNAKMVEDVWGIGVRAAADEEGVVGKEEIKRCIGMVIGGEEIRRSALRWKGMALEAVKEGGSSHNNLKRFLEEQGTEK